MGLNTHTADAREGINPKKMKPLKVALADKNDQRILMEVHSRREHTASSPGRGGTLARRHRVLETNNGQRHLWDDVRNKEI